MTFRPRTFQPQTFQPCTLQTYGSNFMVVKSWVEKFMVEKYTKVLINISILKHLFYFFFFRNDIQPNNLESDDSQRKEKDIELSIPLPADESGALVALQKAQNEVEHLRNGCEHHLGLCYMTPPTKKDL